MFTLGVVWLGALVPKRWAKRAVTRNAIKRQIYAVGQGFESSLQHAAHVVRLRCGFDRARFISATSEALKVAVRDELQQLFTKATTVSAVNSSGAGT
jgi:ribonuclease P protein component